MSAHEVDSNTDETRLRQSRVNGITQIFFEFRERARLFSVVSFRVTGTIP